ncbi:hypothetical protein [Streptomyces caniscabiei]|uniref:hypothetical protein n=1 Tax=Streptomyces caniscabiei TaxID=2746961 RepID=UPI0036F3A0CD
MTRGSRIAVTRIRGVPGASTAWNSTASAWHGPQRPVRTDWASVRPSNWPAPWGDCSLATGLSPAVTAAVAPLVDTVRDEIARFHAAPVGRLP